MALEEVFSERDSEDEVDDDIADLEDRRVRCDYLIVPFFRNVEYIQAVAFT
jgi:hypothetical protein